MQLSAPTNPTELLLATLVAANPRADGVPVPAAPFAAAPAPVAPMANGGAPPSFAQMFPDLAPATATPVASEPGAARSRPFGPPCNPAANSAGACPSVPPIPIVPRESPATAGDEPKPEPGNGRRQTLHRSGAARPWCQAATVPRAEPAGGAQAESPPAAIAWTPPVDFVPPASGDAPIGVDSPPASVRPVAEPGCVKEESLDARAVAAESSSAVASLAAGGTGDPGGGVSPAPRYGDAAIPRRIDGPASHQAGTPTLRHTNAPAARHAESPSLQFPSVPRPAMGAAARAGFHPSGNPPAHLTLAPQSSSAKDGPATGRPALVPFEANPSGESVSPPMQGLVSPARSEPSAFARRGEPALPASAASPMDQRTVAAERTTALEPGPAPRAIAADSGPGESLDSSAASSAPQVERIPSLQQRILVSADGFSAGTLVPRADFVPMPQAPSRDARVPAARNTRAATDPENLAAVALESIAPDDFAAEVPAKTFLSEAAERVMRGDNRLGIGVAESPPTMPARAYQTRSASAEALAFPALPTAAIPATDLAAPTEFGAAPEAPAVAHRAVEAAMRAAERFASGHRQSVSLQFSIGGSDLAVRVELRADEVHATFRTDSPELQSALAHEWQAVSHQSAERPFRLAAPIFTANSSDASGLAAFADGGASGQGHPSRRHGSEVFASVASRGRATARRTVGEISPPAGPPAALPTSLHLHTLA